MSLCMHACMYVRIYVCLHVCMYTCMNVNMYVCVYFCMYVYTFFCVMYVCMYAHGYVFIVCVRTCMYVCICVYFYECMHTHTHPPTDICTHLYSHLPSTGKMRTLFVYFDHKIRPHVYIIYVCTCMLLYMCFTYMEGKNIHVYICKWVGGWVYVYTHTFMYVCIFACEFESMLVCMHPATHPLMCIHMCALTFYPQWGPVTTKSPHCTTLQHAATLCNTPLSPSIQNGDP